ncbi:Ig-like domain-containing protein [Tautonia sociabilis]|uniref:SbsA Ig-like domain-containing protein n=1 Tax=Tautonia sociabilis TaxID=2080755 RepID=A0A432MH09_9BACT|nr:Ig-like domain-containing protein [Tautonia sociabilis]RUL86185.1 hypothetical protein TsocGM_16610 [Tautonia sociabilis]
MIVLVVFALLGGGVPRDDQSPSRPTILLAEDGAFEVAGLDSRSLDLLRSADLDRQPPIVVAVAGAPEPMLGKVRVVGDRLRFEPRFSLRPGTTYQASFLPGRIPGGDPKASPIEAELSVPNPDDAEPARVLAVYPTADVLPENLLRFYLHFSSPMSRGEADHRITLLGPDGEPVIAPFLELDEELWDRSGTRMTLLIDPGRIKRGLLPREELGPVLEAGRSYELVVDPGWPDASGRPLASPFRKAFQAGPADETPPDPHSWRVTPPAAGSRDPLVVSFPEPLDHALAGRLLSVVDPSDRLVPGKVEVASAETRWVFSPERPWRAGTHRLRADTDLEDLAGNGIGRPFEVDVFDRVEQQVEARIIALPFEIGP